MLKLWLVVLLGFVASARGGRLYSFMSHEAVEKQFKRICDKYPENFKPTDTVIPDVKYRTQSGGNYTGLKVDDVRMDSLSLRDSVYLSINLSMNISFRRLLRFEVDVKINIIVIWNVSPRGSLKVDSDDMSINISLKSQQRHPTTAERSRRSAKQPPRAANDPPNRPLNKSTPNGSCKPLEQDLPENLISASHSFLKTHFGACIKGILGIFNENLEYGGWYHHALVKSVVTGVSIVKGGLIIWQRLVDQNGKEIPCDGNRNVPALTRGRGWGTILTNDLIKTLWRNAPKKHTWKWPASLLQKYFGPDVSLGSYVDITVSMDNARSCNINSKGINISAGAKLTFSSESRKPLLRTSATVEVSVNLTARGGRIGIDYVGVSKPRDMKVTYLHSGCTINNILNSIEAEIEIFRYLDLVGYDSRVLFSPGVPRSFSEYSDPVIRCYDGEGDKEGYCTLMY